MRRHVILSIVTAACAHIGLSQTVTVQPSTIPGVEIVGPLSPGYAADIDQVLAPPRSPALNAWLPFGVVLRNTTQQNIVGVALRWSATLTNESTSSGTAMSLTEAPRHQIAPGEIAVALPGLGEVLVPGDASALPARLRLNAPPDESTASDAADLASYRTARNIEIVLDGVVFASGQFMGPDTGNEYEKWLADTTAPEQVAARVLAMKASGEPIGNIVAWLEQTAKSENSADPTADVSGTTAHRFLQTYQKQGEAALYQRAQSGPGLAIHLYR
jgi:hypothetical protein